MIGFTAGAGILIGFKQLKHVFGLKVPQGSSFYEIISYIINHIQETNWYVFAVAITTLLIAIVVKKIKYISRLNYLIAMILGSVLALVLGGNAVGIETIGDVPSSLPPFSIPNFNFENMRMITGGAITLALIGLVEAVSISRVIALHSHQKLNNNQEFIGQGLANIVSSFFSSYVSSGSFSRSGANYQSGAKTPMSSIIASLGLFLVVLFLANYASHLAKPAMGGIILLVGYNLIDFKHIKQVVSSSKREFIVLSVTLLGTLFLDLETALFLGILISLFFYLERTSKPNIAVLGKNEAGKFINIIRDNTAEECPQLKILRIDGSIYFGAVDGISNCFTELYDKGEKKHLLVIANGINFVDLAGAEWLTQEVLKWQKRGGGIYFVGLKIVSQDILRRGGFVSKIGAENFYFDKKSAISSIYKKLDKEKCYTCEIKLFQECE